ncbi:MAG: hemolysin III family protein [Deltaproteobacteria bacterium]|nr:hemolysin III family protein [Deltaproteobacteria bacterium]
MAWSHIENSAYSPSEEALNVLTHGGGLILGIVGAALALAEASTPAQWWSLSIYSATLVLLFSASTLYHFFHHHKVKPWLQKLDHAAIYLFIAGSYTPFLLLALKDSSFKIPLLAIVWSLAVLGVFFKMRSGDRYSKVGLATYLTMGWLMIVVIKDIIAALPNPALALLVVGGLCFTGGLVFYANEKIRFNHAIWHLFVLAGVACHFVSIYSYILAPQA